MKSRTVKKVAPDEKIFTAKTYIFKGGALHPYEKEFKSAVAAYKYLHRKLMKYSGITEVSQTIECDGEIIYENINDGEETTSNPEIQKLMDKWNAEIEHQLEIEEINKCIAFFSCECAITPEAFEVAVQAEIDNATADTIAEENQEVAVEEYAVTPEALEVATQAEFDNAEIVNDYGSNDEPKIVYSYLCENGSYSQLIQAVTFTIGDSRLAILAGIPP